MEIYVGNLAYATTDDGLKAAFAQLTPLRRRLRLTR